MLHPAGYSHGAMLGEQPGCRESWGRAASGPCSPWCGCQRPLCFAGSLAGESCVPECLPTMYLSREPRRCESCPAGTGTSSPPAPARENPKSLGCVVFPASTPLDNCARGEAPRGCCIPGSHACTLQVLGCVPVGKAFREFFYFY